MIFYSLFLKFCFMLATTPVQTVSQLQKIKKANYTRCSLKVSYKHLDKGPVFKNPSYILLIHPDLDHSQQC